MGHFKEAREGVLELPDMEPETFDLIVQWVYIGKYQIPDYNASFSMGHVQKKRHRQLDLTRWVDQFRYGEDRDIIDQAVKAIKVQLHYGIHHLAPQTTELAFATKCYELKKLIAEQCVIPYLRWEKTQRGHPLLRDPETYFHSRRI